MLHEMSKRGSQILNQDEDEIENEIEEENTNPSEL